VIGFYRRYGIEKHRDLVEVWPELGDVLFRDTYKDASEAARAECLASLKSMSMGPVTWVHHPHKENSDDPLELFGSWGWKRG
jgi:hypothetical protein